MAATDSTPEKSSSELPDLLDMQNEQDETVAITFRPPYIATFKDKCGLYHTSTFEKAPSWKYWKKLPDAWQIVILEINAS